MGGAGRVPLLGEDVVALAGGRPDVVVARRRSHRRTAPLGGDPALAQAGPQVARRRGDRAGAVDDRFDRAAQVAAHRGTGGVRRDGDGDRPLADRRRNDDAVRLAVAAPVGPVDQRPAFARRRGRGVVDRRVVRRGDHQRGVGPRDEFASEVGVGRRTHALGAAHPGVGEGRAHDDDPRLAGEPPGLPCPHRAPADDQHALVGEVVQQRNHGWGDGRRYKEGSGVGGTAAPGLFLLDIGDQICTLPPCHSRRLVASF